MAALSNSFGRFVAPITRTYSLEEVLTPSNCTKNSFFNLLEASCSFSERAVSIESISSIKIIVGDNFRASLNILTRVFSDYPKNLFNMDEAERAMKVHFDLWAKALQRKVFPFPGGP